MNFLLTTYIYPLNKPILLSESLGISIDNPRTNEELSYIEEYLKNSHENSPDPVFPPESDEEVVSLQWVLENFYENCLIHDKHALKTYEKSQGENVYLRFARMWIVARYDDQGELERLKVIHQEMERKGEKGLIVIDDDHPIEKAKSNLVNYFSLLSLLCHTQPNEYYGRQILADNKFSDMERHVPNRDLWRHHFMMFMIHSTNKDWREMEDPMNWTFFPKVKEVLIKVAVKVEKTLTEEGSDNLLYIGSILDTVYPNSSEDKVKIVFLTSVLEFLLTHNPDYNRFNVEESINKQFQLKTAVLVYINNKDQDIYLIKEKLKNIYRLRSCIAHGNFGELNKMLTKLSKNSGEEIDLSYFVSELYDFIRAVLEVRLEDQRFVEFLKMG